MIGGGEGADNAASDDLRAARKQQWGNLSDPAREQFYWAAPGTYSGDAPPVVPTGGRGEDGKVLDPPPSFLLMLLHPQRVKYLRLTDNFAQVDVRQGGVGDRGGDAEVEAGWSSSRTNP